MVENKDFTISVPNKIAEKSRFLCDVNVVYCTIFLNCITYIVQLWILMKFSFVYDVHCTTMDVICD